MRSLITGVDGFIGGWLASALVSEGDDVHGLARRERDEPRAGVTRHVCDVRDRDAVAALVGEVTPERVFHLAALNNIAEAFGRPQDAFEINVSGSLNVFEAVRARAPEATLISVGSSAEYGKTTAPEGILSEWLPLAPSSHYGVTKACQGMLARLYADSYGLRFVHARPFAIVGPAKTGDALSDFCRTVVRIERGDVDRLRVGDLEATRDFVDVRDCAQALELVSTSGVSGQTYNVSSGRAERISILVDLLRATAAIPFDVVVDRAKVRAVDDARLVGDPAALNALGFVPTHALADTVRDTLDYWRSRA